MSGAFFTDELASVATYWRIMRRDGVALGFTAHDRDLVFGGLVHRAGPGMVPSALRLSLALEDDETAIEGALSHAAIREDDLAAGLYDDALVEIGVVDWETLAAQPLHFGSLAAISREGQRFSAELVSHKADLARDRVPRTSPGCRAQFCGPGCNLSPARFETRVTVTGCDTRRGRVTIDAPVGPALVGGRLRLVGDSLTGQAYGIVAVVDGALALDRPPAAAIAPGTAAILRQGCDHTIATCAARFGNAVNFRGEPFLPGTDMLAQYPVSR